MKFKELLSEMANVRPAKTGLSMVVYISTKFEVPHGPRLKVCKKHGDKFIGDTFSITISDEPRIIGKTGKEISAEDIIKVKKFIFLNKKTLLDYWDLKIDTADMIMSMKKIT